MDVGVLLLLMLVWGSIMRGMDWHDRDKLWLYPPKQLLCVHTSFHLLGLI